MVAKTIAVMVRVLPLTMPTYPSYEINRKRNDTCNDELQIKSTCGNETTITYVASK